MDRERIRIIEFGDDGEPDDRRNRAPESVLSGTETTAGDRQAEPERHVATPETVGPVKIREFDGEQADVRRPAMSAVTGSGRSGPRLPSREDIRIVEFDRQVPSKGAVPRRTSPRHTGLKVVEFD